MSPSFRFLFAAAIALLFGAGSLAWSEPENVDRRERLAQGGAAFRDNCLMCHSEELTTRARFSAKQWTTEIDKMIGWGAPVPPELKGPLFDYLMSEFSDPKAAPVPPPSRITLAEALALIRPEGPRAVVGDATRGAALYVTNCAICHGPEGLGGDLGTCLVEKPVLLRPADYHRIVRQGLRRMPGFAAALTPEQEADILTWLRARRFEPFVPGKTGT
jgi:ubiquinol-cytochrome c reductase cytochrome c subunit